MTYDLLALPIPTLPRAIASVIVIFARRFAIGARYGHFSSGLLRMGLWRRRTLKSPTYDARDIVDLRMIC
jgi:hypothetical protein